MLRLAAERFAESPERRLTELIRAKLGPWPGPGDTEAGAQESEARPESPAWKRRRFDGLPVHAMLELLAMAGPQPDTLAVARRAACYMQGPSGLLWQYIAVSVSPAWPVGLFGGWEVAPIDLVRDEKLPLSYGRLVYPNSPCEFHLARGYGALRRPSGEGDVPDEESESDERVLTLPLLALNLASDHPVHAGVSYYVNPGRGRAMPPGARPENAGFCSQPRELRNWDDTRPSQVQPRGSRKLGAESTRQLARFAPELGSRLLRLDDGQRERLIRAADQYLIVAHRTTATSGEAPEVPAMHEPEAVFRWISAVEGLLNGDDKSRRGLTRKTAKRAAVLIGHDDDSRLAVRNLITRAYEVRSDYAHGSSPPSVDLTALRAIIRKIIVAWIVLAADSPAGPLSAGLDDALLSAQTLEETVTLPLKRFWEHAK